MKVCKDSTITIPFSGNANIVCDRVQLAVLHRRAGRGVRRGATLIEIVIVIMILAIISVAVTPRFFSSLAYHRAESAAQRIQFDCQWARRRAKTQSADQVVQFNPNANSYTLLTVAGLNQAATDYVVELAAYPYAAGIVSADFDGQQELVFDGFGLPKQTGIVVVQSGTSRRSISFDPDTGSATVSDEY